MKKELSSTENCQRTKAVGFVSAHYKYNIQDFVITYLMLLHVKLAISPPAIWFVWFSDFSSRISIIWSWKFPHLLVSLGSWCKVEIYSLTWGDSTSSLKVGFSDSQTLDNFVFLNIQKSCWGVFSLLSPITYLKAC